MRQTWSSAADADDRHVSESVDAGSEAASVPSTLYLLGPGGQFEPGQRRHLEHLYPEDRAALEQYADRPSFFGHSPIAGDPSGLRIWRFVADDAATVRPGPRPGLWICPSATFVEELSPATLMPAWDDVVALCARLRPMTHEDAVRVAEMLPDAQRTAFSRPASIARRWVSWTVGFAARAADSPSHPVMHSYRAMGSWYEDIIDPAWLRVEAAAEALADGLADGTATLATEGAWLSRVNDG
jgi:hypothetical protein